MSTSLLPTIVLVPGAFTTGECYDDVVPQLREQGFETVVASYKSMNPGDPYSCSAEEDGEMIVSQSIQPLLDGGKDVLVFAHSYGATALGNSGHSLVKSERRTRGMAGGIIGIVYMAFATVSAGDSQLSYLGGEWPPFCQLDTPTNGLVKFNPVIDTLYNDTPKSIHYRLEAGHLPHAIKAFTTPVLPPLWADRALTGRRIWIIPTLDATFPPDLQRNFAATSGVDWTV